MVSSEILIQDGQVNEEALKELFRQLMVINPSIELYLLDPQGKILTFSAPTGKVKRERVSLDSLNRFLSGAEDFPILGDDPRDPTRKKVFSVFPIETLSGEAEIARIAAQAIGGPRWAEAVTMLVAIALAVTVHVAGLQTRKAARSGP